MEEKEKNFEEQRQGSHDVHGCASKQQSYESLSCHCQITVVHAFVWEKLIFDDFYKLADHDSQNKYLYGLIEQLVPKQRRPQTSAAKKTRANTFHYYVCLSSGDLIKVCKQTFCEIHRIGKYQVENL